MRLAATAALVILISAALAGGYFYLSFEAPRASGPLVQDLIARFDPEARNQDLGDAVAAHVDPALRLSDQQRIFHANGFDCFVATVKETGSAYLTCRRPIEGRHYCDQLLYYVYQTAAGANVHRLATVVRRDNRGNIFGRCDYEPFPDDEPIERFPPDG